MRNPGVLMSHPGGLESVSLPVFFLQLLGMAFSMTLFQQIHRSGKKYDA